MIMVGYHPTRAYRLYNPAINEICISKHVVMDEKNLWDSTNLNGGLGSQNVLVVIGNGEENSSVCQENLGGSQSNETMYVQQQV